jgi:hypothetical protein
MITFENNRKEFGAGPFAQTMRLAIRAGQGEVGDMRANRHDGVFEVGLESAATPAAATTTASTRSRGGLRPNQRTGEK